MSKNVSPIDMLFDENNTENIVLYDEENNEVEFEQIAVIPLENDGKQDLYAILLPLTPLAGIEEDEALVFEINERENVIRVCGDDNIIDRVMTEYEKLLGEGEGNN